MDEQPFDDQPPEEVYPSSPYLYVPDYEPPAPGMGRVRRFFYGTISLILALVMCAGLTGGIISFNWFRTWFERDDIHDVTHEFLTQMEAQQAHSAYALFSQRGQIQHPLPELQSRFARDAFVLFEGYQKIDITELTIHTVASPIITEPQGTVAELWATIFYLGGIEGRLRVILEKEDDGWHIYDFYISVPPAKYFEQRNTNA